MALFVPCPKKDSCNVKKESRRLEHEFPIHMMLFYVPRNRKENYSKFYQGIVKHYIITHKIWSAMKKFYHICITAHSEVLLRNIDDVRLFTNTMAHCAWRNHVELLTDSIMSTHLHETVLCEDPFRFVWSQLLSFTKAFNHRHGRSGSLFDSHPFIQQLVGPRHTNMAICYSLRQGFHHGISETAFEYPWSTCNYLFPKERGASSPSPLYCDTNSIRKLICKNAETPDGWTADENGILLRNSFEQLNYVENWFSTAKSYIYSMVRKTSEEWVNDQKKDETNEKTVTLQYLEKGYSDDDIKMMLANEGNSKFINKRMSDFELCSIIDNDLIRKYKKNSIYSLPVDTRKKIGEILYHDLNVKSAQQVSRCLALKYP